MKAVLEAAPWRSRKPGALCGCPPLEAALATWKDVTFDYESTNTVDYVATPTAA